MQAYSTDTSQTTASRQQSPDNSSVWNQEPRLQKFKEDGHQWIVKHLYEEEEVGFVGRFCGERGDVHEGWSAH